MGEEYDRKMFSETVDITTATSDYASRFTGAIGEYFLQRQTETTLSLLSDLPKAKVLDVGGGHAQLAEPLVKNGFDVTVTGSDDSCKKRLIQQIPQVDFEYTTCDYLHLPFVDRSFDVVIAFRLLSHVENWPRLIAELTRVAKHCVIFDYTDKRSMNILYNQFFELKKKMEGETTRPFNIYNRAEIKRELKDNGFQSPSLRPQYFCPMVLHRRLNNPRLTAVAESGFLYTGLTRVLGSPIIVRSNRLG
ncbi:MAG: ubiquinone/menaquinone biosynthesis C-methylase UbiE [Desulforhopalus sp.]|jgi:ubiquinone/menaquinone biosynthesis C-methylase UbiE